ncbi:SDR family oxidoreductase [Rhodococcus pseudokoreensis]|uniref:SDR family oxidoreductase n=1 Tax=Rhodococcus pseudokoreensis TaxID=2811421 RepID=A0A974W9D0_9NOCA|nr:SDR family NAD(P)-dependent oxidoreductase [Rhodococcus pseudokoreensis]QSE93673.1 SDR family oxidoreductase [Rhodococcus pseudokoreensis]
MVTYPEGATALVTGGASGIGAACAKRLADADAVENLAARLGRVDILVNSAGVVGPSAPLVDVELEDWRRTFRINVEGTFLVCRAFVPAMTNAGWGRVVNLASIAAKDGNPGQSAYSASKAAVIALTKSLGKEVATTGVLANVVAPAAVESPMNAGTDPAILARSQSLTPMARMGRPEEIAELVAWLSSEALSFSTGAVYDASGGRASY